MVTVKYTLLASKDLEEIAEYISYDSVYYAGLQIIRLLERVKQLQLIKTSAELFMKRELNQFVNSLREITELSTVLWMQKQFIYLRSSILKEILPDHWSKKLLGIPNKIIYV